MERKACPYLARPNDGGTLSDFPSEANFCQKATSPELIRRDYQSTFCLNEQHSVCPVFQATVVSQLPAMAATPRTRALETRKKLTNTLFVAGVVLYILISVWFSGSKLAARILSFTNQMYTADIRMAIPVTGLSENGWQRPRTGSRSTELQPNTAAQAQVAADCTLPQGWQVYTVQPDDSIFRISTLYGISQEALMKANCLSSYTNLTPGSTLFIPAPAPTATATATATTPPSLPHSPPSNSGGGDAPASIEAVSPTAVPPTQVPTVPVPPVQDPVIVPDNPEPTKDDKPANPPKTEDKQDKDDKDKGDQDQGKKDDRQKDDKDKGNDDGKRDDKDKGRDDGKKDDKDNGKADEKRDDKDNGKDDRKKDDKDNGKADEKKDDKDNGKDDREKGDKDKGKKGG